MSDSEFKKQLITSEFAQNQFQENYQHFNVYSHYKGSNIQEYLESLNKFSLFMNNYNKPLFISLNGTLCNSAVSVFTHNTLAYGKEGKTKIQFNETNNGFVPTGGASYTLSRLPFFLGNYLALTGDILNANEMFQLNMIDDIFKENISREELMKIFERVHRMYKIDQIRHSEWHHGNQYYDNTRENEDQRQKFYETLAQEIKLRVVQNNKTDNRRVLADIIYKKRLVEYANQNKNNIYYQNQEYLNYSEMYNFQALRFCQGLFLERDSISKKNLLPIDLIIYIFSCPKVEVIIDRLYKSVDLVKSGEYTNKYFAKEFLLEWIEKTKFQLETRQPISMQLTLELIKKAQGSSFSECLNNEKTVAMNRAQDQDFRAFCKAKLQFGEHTPAIGSNNKKISDYFIQQTNHTFPSNMMVPRKVFQQGYIDNVRNFLNMRSVNDINQRDGQEFDVSKWLYSHGINAYSSHLNADDVRSVFMELETTKEVNKLKLRDVDQAGYSQFLIKQFQKNRKDKIEEFFEQDQNIFIDKLIEKIFEKKFDEKIKKLQEFSQIMQPDYYREEILELRRLLYHMRLGEGSEKESFRSNFHRQLQLNNDHNQDISIWDKPHQVGDKHINQYLQKVKEIREIHPKKSQKDIVKEIEKTKLISTKPFKKPVNRKNFLTEEFEEELDINHRRDYFKNVFNHDFKIVQYQENVDKYVKYLKIKEEEVNQYLQDKKLQDYIYKIEKEENLQTFFKQIHKNLKQEQKITKEIEQIDIPHLNYELEETEFFKFIQKDEFLSDLMQIFTVKQENIDVNKFQIKFQKMLLDICEQQITMDPLPFTSKDKNIQKLDEFIQNQTHVLQYTNKIGKILAIFANLGFKQLVAYYRQIQFNYSQNNNQLFKGLELKGRSFFDVGKYLDKVAETLAILNYFYENNLTERNFKTKLLNKLTLENELVETELIFSNVEALMKNLVREKIDLIRKMDSYNQTEQMRTPFLGVKPEQKDQLNTQGNYLYLERIDFYTQKLINGATHYIPKTFILNELENHQQYKEFEQQLLNLDDQEWLERTVEKVLTQFFEVRYEYEQQLSTNQLYASDLYLAELITQPKIKELVQDQLKRDIHILQEANQEQRKKSSHYNSKEFKDYMNENVKEIYNYDALNKYQTQMVLLSDKYKHLHGRQLSHAEKRKHKKDKEEDDFVTDRLMQQARQFPRDIDLKETPNQVIRDVLGIPQKKIQKDIVDIEKENFDRRRAILLQMHKNGMIGDIEKDFKRFLEE